MNAPLYTTEILRLAASLPEPVKLDRVDGRASKRSPTCGSRVDVEVQLDARGKVQALSQTVHACAFGQASAAIIAAAAAGRSAAELESTLDELRAWLAGETETAPAWPGFTALEPARSRRSRHGAILLPLEALAGAVRSSAT